MNSRRNWGVLAVTVAAPYLTFILAFAMWSLFFEPFANPAEYLAFLVLGTIGLFFYGLPLFLLAYILAVLGCW